MQRVHSASIAAMLWLTNRMVRESRRATSPIFPRHFFWNSASPTASTSSTTRISGSRWAATAKASRTYMPLLYRFTGSVEEVLDARELHDGVELARDLALPHPEDRAVQVDVLAAGELGVEAGSHFEQAADAPVQMRPRPPWAR